MEKASYQKLATIWKMLASENRTRWEVFSETNIKNEHAPCDVEHYTTVAVWSLAKTKQYFVLLTSLDICFSFTRQDDLYALLRYRAASALHIRTKQQKSAFHHLSERILCASELLTQD